MGGQSSHGAPDLDCECSWKTAGLWPLFSIGGCLKDTVLLFGEENPVRSV